MVYWISFFLKNDKFFKKITKKKVLIFFYDVQEFFIFINIKKKSYL